MLKTFLAHRVLPLALLASPILAQGVSEGGAPTTTPAPAPVLRAFDTMAGTLQDLQVPADPRGPFTVDVVLGGEPRRLHLRPHDIRSPDFRLLVADDLGIRQVPTPPSVTWRGEVEGDHGGFVAASLIQGRLSALIAIGGRAGFWNVQALREVDPTAPAGRYLVFHSEDNANTGHRCGVPDPTGAVPQPAPQEMTTTEIAEIAIDADFQFFQQNGSNVTATQNDVTSVMNRVDAIYLRDTQITYQITTILVRSSSASNPYTTNDPGSLLNQFSSHWITQQGSIRRDVAHLFTGRNLSGSVIGIATLSSICSSTRGYGLSQSRFSTNITRRTGLTAHELGHNWSAQHCNSFSDCRIMCSGLGGCTGILTSFAPVSINSILSHKNTRTCLSPALTQPVLSSISPNSVQAFQPPQVTLTGSGFNGATSVQVGTLTLTSGFTVASDTSISLTPPTAPMLGSVPVTVTNPIGTSNAVNLTYTATVPPVLEAPAAAVNGNPLTLDFGGQPNHVYMLIVSLGSTTVPTQGFPILQSFSILNLGTLDATGLGTFTINLPNTGSFNLLSVWTQMVEADPMTLQLTGASGVEGILLFL